MAKYVYPAIFHPNENDGSYTVTFPKFPGCITEGKNMADALFLVQDALEVWLADSEDHKDSIPVPGAPPQVVIQEFVNLVIADTTAWRKKHDSRAVKKPLSIPNWLNTLAEEAGVNFPQILQDTLKERLNIS